MEFMVRILLARLRLPVLMIGAALLITGSVVGPSWCNLAGGALVAAAFVSALLPQRLLEPGGSNPPVQVLPPVRGTWMAANSPASRVPSHGVHLYGQTYAIDLIPGTRLAAAGFLRWPPGRPASAFAGFGQPVLAPFDGIVVRASDWQRDHWSREGLPGVLYLLAEGSLRELTGPGRIIGNHVVLDRGDGVYALFAHLKRRSLLVRRGQRVQAGAVLAACGNSGNSTEPHLHFQLMDHPSPGLASGLPFEFASYQESGEVRSGVPRSQTMFTVGR